MADNRGEKKNFYSFIKHTVKPVPKKRQVAFSTYDPIETVRPTSTPKAQKHSSSLQGTSATKLRKPLNSGPLPEVKCLDRGERYNQISDQLKSTDLTGLSSKLDELQSRLSQSSRNLQKELSESSITIPKIYPTLSGLERDRNHPEIETLETNNYLNDSLLEDEEDSDRMRRYRRDTPQHVGHLNERESDVSVMARAFSKLGPVLEKLDRSLTDRSGAENSTIESLFRSPRSMLPLFDKADYVTWYKIVEKRFKDYNINNEYDKYQLVVNLFKPEELKALEPFLSVGSKKDYFQNLLRGISKVYGKSIGEVVRSGLSITYDGTVLPSIIVRRIKDASEFHMSNEQALERFHHTLTGSAYRLMELHYRKLSFDEYLDLADDLHIRGCLVDSTAPTDATSKNEAVSKSELTIMTMLAFLQDTVQAQNKIIAENKDRLRQMNSGKRFGSSNSGGYNRPPVAYNKSTAESGTSVPYKPSSLQQPAFSSSQNTSNTGGNQQATNRDPPSFVLELNPKSPICEIHQKFGVRAKHCCNVLVGSCDWNNVVKCDKHANFANRAFKCVDPSNCQYEFAVKYNLN